MQYWMHTTQHSCANGADTYNLSTQGATCWRRMAMAARWVWMAWKRAGASISRSMMNLHTFLLSDFTCGRKSQCSTAYTTSVPRPRAM